MIRSKQTSMPAAGAAPGREHRGTRHRARAVLLALAAWLVSAAAPAADYVNDPTWGWGTGRMQDDAFFGAADQNYSGRRAARFSNGDVVVAGTVPHNSGYGAIGLVRYAENGTSGRVAWTNPGAHGTNSNQYVVYPGVSLTRITQVQDVMVHGNLMFVLADVSRFGLPTSPPFNPYYRGDGTAVYVFGTDGSFKSENLVDEDTVNADVNDPPTIYGGGLLAWTDVYDPPSNPLRDYLVYVGRKRMAGGNERITFRRYSFTAAGALTAQTNLIHPAISECTANVHCSAFGIAAGGQEFQYDTPRVYITGARYVNNAWEAYAAQISPYTGATTGMGYRNMGAGRGRAIAVNPHYEENVRDDVYVLAERDQNCAMGMLVSAYRRNAPTTWNRTVGGSNNTNTDCQMDVNMRGVRQVVPTSLAIQGGRLAAAGYGYYPAHICFSPPCEIMDGAIAVLDASNGDLISPIVPGSHQPKYYEYTNTSGTRTRHSTFHDILAAGNGRFTAAGDVRYPNTHSTPSYRGKLAYASLRVLEGSGGGDLPFSDGFEGDDGQPPQPAQLRGTNIAGMTVAHYTCTQAGGPVPGTNFHTADTRLVDYYAGKGMKVLRLKVTWECLQPVLNGPVPAAGANYQTYFNSMKTMVDYATNTKGMHVVITPWQSDSQQPYAGLCGACYQNVIIGSSAAVTNAHFADFWAKMANHFKANPRVGFSLINEPNRMSTMQWFATAQAAITAIRNTGATQQTIYVPGNGWTGASTWTSSDYDTASPKRSNAYGWLNARGPGQPLLDPQNKLVVEVHTYADTNQGGLDDGITSVTSVRDHVKHTVDWANANGQKVYLGEIGLYSGNALAAQTWQNFVTYASANTNTLVGFTWWAGGYPGWWDNEHAPYFSITPTNAANYTGDTANMNMIKAAFQ